MITQVPYTKENIERYKSSDNLLRHARTKGCDGIILVDGTKLVGYVGWEKNWIISLEVSKDYRSKGFGGKLLDKAIREGCNGLTVDSENTVAISLYKSRGFITAGWIGADRINMVRVASFFLVSATPKLKTIEPKVKVYKTIEDAITGRYLDQNLTGKTLTVYSPRTKLNLESLLKPSLADCPYGLVIDEYWYLRDMDVVETSTIQVDQEIGTVSYHTGPRSSLRRIKRWRWHEELKRWEKTKLL